MIGSLTDTYSYAQSVIKYKQYGDILATPKGG